MGHLSRRAAAIGVEIVRFTTYSAGGTTLLLRSDNELPDEFVTLNDRILLCTNHRRLRNRVASLRLSDKQRAQVAGLLALNQALRPTRWHSFVRTQRTIELPVNTWRWSRRSVILDRLDILWDCAETLHMDRAKDLLGRSRALGKIADLCYEDFSGDSEFRRALQQIKHDQLIQDMREVLRLLDGRFVVR